jgi:peroxiredoxin
MPENLRRTTAAVCLACLLAHAGPAAGDELPRYRLKVGQVLDYRSSYKADYGFLLHDIIVLHREWSVRVLRQNADGSWQLLVRVRFDPWPRPPGPPGPVVEELAYCTLFPDGRLGPVVRASHHDSASLEALFPRLPADAAAAARGWEDPTVYGNVSIRYAYSARSPQPGKLDFTGSYDSRRAALDPAERKTTFTFDFAQGLVVKSSGTSRETFGNPHKGTAEMNLVGNTELSGDALRQLAAEADFYFAAVQTYRQLVEKALRRADAKELLATAEAFLVDARKKVTDPPLLKRCDELLRWHQSQAEDWAKYGAAVSAVLDKPAPDWSTKDLRGKPAAFSDYRGKVVVLAFWSREWGEGVLPQLNRVADNFRGEPVAVLGMCTNPKKEDAKFVTEKIDVHVPVLLADGVAAKYHVHGLPTLIVIDAKGTVRDVILENSPTLHETVSENIRKLLAESKITAN